MFKVSKLTGIKKPPQARRLESWKNVFECSACLLDFLRCFFEKKNVKFHRLLRNVNKYCATKIASSDGLMEQIAYINLIGLHF